MPVDTRAVTVNPRSSVPVYVQVAGFIRARITSGELEPDTPLPSEAQIVQEYGIARHTARKAIEVLRDEGLIITVKGKGSYVRP